MIINDNEIILIQLTKDTNRLLHRYAEKKGKTVEEFLSKLVSDSIYAIQYSEKIMKDLAEWNIPQLIEVTPSENFYLKIKFDDGLVGKFNFKPYFRHGGEYSDLANFDFFKQVSIGENGEFIVWPGGLEVGANTIYMTLSNEDWLW